MRSGHLPSAGATWGTRVKLATRVLIALYLCVPIAASLSAAVDLSMNRFDCEPFSAAQHPIDEMGCAARAIALAAVAALWIPAVPGLPFLLAPMGRSATIAGVVVP